MTDLDKATATYWRLVDRYNREYRAGKWSTNRPLASKCENAYSECVRLAQLEGVVCDV